MRHDKAAMVIDLARRMAASAEGLTLDDMARETGMARRTVERMRDAVLQLFPTAEEVSDPPTKRWRIRGGLSGGVPTYSRTQRSVPKTRRRASPSTIARRFAPQLLQCRPCWSLTYAISWADSCHAAESSGQRTSKTPNCVPPQLEQMSIAVRLKVDDGAYRRMPRFLNRTLPRPSAGRLPFSTIQRLQRRHEHACFPVPRHCHPRPYIGYRVGLRAGSQEGRRPAGRGCEDSGRRRCHSRR